MRETDRQTDRQTTSHNIKSHQDKCMSNLNLRAKKTYKKQSTRKTNPQAQSAQAEPTYRRPFSLASRKVPLNPFFLTAATADRKAASAISQTPLCCSQPSLPRARALSLFSLSLSLALSVSVETRGQFVFTPRFLWYILSLFIGCCVQMGFVSFHTYELSVSRQKTAKSASWEGKSLALKSLATTYEAPAGCFLFSFFFNFFQFF